MRLSAFRRDPPPTLEPGLPAKEPAPPQLQPSGSSLSLREPAVLWNRDFLLLLAASVSFFLGLHLLLPTMPLYAVRLGGGEVAAGLVTGLFSLAALAARPLSGWLLDAYSRRAVFVVGTALCLLVVLAHEWVVAIGLLLALRLLHGGAFGLATTAGGTLASDLVPSTRLGQGLGYFAVSMGLPLAVSPVLGIWLAGRGDFALLFALATLLTLVSVLFTVLLRAPRHRQPAGGNRPSLLGSMLERRSLFPSALMFLLMGTTGVITALLALYGEERGIGNAGIFFTVYALVLSLTRSLAGSMADRWGFRRTAAVGLAFAVAGVLTISAAQSLWVLLIAGALYALGYGMGHPSLQALAVHTVAPARRGAAMAAFYTALDLGMGVGSIGAGYLAAAFPMASVFFLSALMPLTALGLLLAQAGRALRSAGGDGHR